MIEPVNWFTTGYSAMATTRPAVPIAENNPFLTNKHLAPANHLRHELQSGTGSQYDTDEFEEDEDEQEGSECSERSAESEYTVDETVKEEMEKLEDTFREIGMRFRMIARIGEGNARILASLMDHPNHLLTDLFRNFLNRLQGRRLALRILPERLGHRGKGFLEVDISSPQEKKARFYIGHRSWSAPPA